MDQYMIHDDMGEWERKIYLTSPIKGKDLNKIKTERGEVCNL